MSAIVQTHLLPTFDKVWTAIAGSKKQFKTLVRDFILPDTPIVKDFDFLTLAGRMRGLVLSCKRVSNLTFEQSDRGNAVIEYPFFAASLLPAVVKVIMLFKEVCPSTHDDQLMWYTAQRDHVMALLPHVQEFTDDLAPGVNRLKGLVTDARDMWLLL